MQSLTPDELTKNQRCPSCEKRLDKGKELVRLVVAGLVTLVCLGCGTIFVPEAALKVMREDLRKRREMEGKQVVMPESGLVRPH